MGPPGHPDPVLNSTSIASYSPEETPNPLISIMVSVKLTRVSELAGTGVSGAKKANLQKQLGGGGGGEGLEDVNLIRDFSLFTITDFVLFTKSPKK